MTDKADIINTNIFKNNQQKCNGYNHCASVKRIMTALTYYNEIFSQKPDDFINFCDKYYSKNYLQDYIHVICIHKNVINKDETKTKTCRMVSGCLSTTRHYRDRTTNQDIKKDENNGTPHLYVDIFDSLHFYMYHMEECGLRI
eukprot:68772_1